MNPYRLRAGSPWLMRREEFWSLCRADMTHFAGLLPKEPKPVDGPTSPRRPYSVLNGVAVIPVHGVIYRHSTFIDDLFSLFFGGVSVDALADALRAAVSDPDARSVLFTFDSPGGEVAGVGELAGMIRAAGAVKPVAAYAEFLCCSAAYWLASACGEITAAPTALPGSIGVVTHVVDDSGLQEKLGVKIEVICSDISPDKAPDVATDEGRAVYQKTMDDLAAVFAADVAAYRGVPVSAVLSDFGRGGVLIAADAKKAGMIDKVGTFEDALTKLSGANRNRLAKASPAAASVPTTSPPGRLRLRLKPQGSGRA